MASLTQTGPSSFRVLIRQKGKKTICKTFKTRAEAEKFKRRAEADIESGKPVSTIGGLTVGACITAFRELRAKRRPIKPQSNEEYMLRHLDAGLGRVLVDRLTPQRLAEWCTERAEDGAGPYTIGMETAKLATVLKYAAISMNVVLPDVVGAAKVLLSYSGLVGPGKARERRPSADELARVLAKLDPTMQDIVQFAIATAMRRAEIVGLLWTDVDEARRLVLVRDRKHPTAKVGNHQWVPLIADTGIDAWMILQRQPKIDKRIFPLSKETVSDRFLSACRAAGVENLHFHDARHEACSRLFESGMPIEQVAMVTGHSNWSNLKRYTNLRPESLTAGSRPDTAPSPDSRTSARRQRDTSEVE